MSDLVINVKQIGSYPPLNPITGTEMLLVQSGGLGGPYYSVQMSAMIVNTLANFEGPIAIGVGQAPADGNPDSIFTGDSVLTNGPLGVSFNAYGYQSAGYKYWQNGPAACFFLDPASGSLIWQSAPVGSAGGIIMPSTGGPSAFTSTMNLSSIGYLQVATTLLVGRNPTLPLEVATKGYVDGLTSSIVQSWNGRTGAVSMTIADVLNVGGAPLNNTNLTGIPTAPTPPLGTNTNQIATTAWVLNEVSAISAGVVSWNGRSGVVTMTPADITSGGGLTVVTANATYLSLGGGTMQGPIIMVAGATANMEVPVLGQVGARVGASTPPALPAPLSGNLWWDSAGAQLYAWTGQQWVIAVNPPIPNTANFLALSGGTMTGPISLPGNAAQPLQAVPLQQVATMISANIGRNYLHNAIFGVIQRGPGPFSAGGYTLDRWTINSFGAFDVMSVTQTALTDTDRAQIGDQAAVSCFQNNYTGSSNAGAGSYVEQRVEDVHRLGNKTVTLSFWAKCTSGTLNLGVNLYQFFGTGGSPSPVVTVLPTGLSAPLTTIWQRFSFTIAIPSIAGQTLGTNGDSGTWLRFWYSAGATSNTQAGNIGPQSGTVQIWGTQLELGSYATPFEHRDYAIEVALCQRFYHEGTFNLQGYNLTNNNMTVIATFPFFMRATPTVVPTVNSISNCTGSLVPANSFSMGVNGDVTETNSFWYIGTYTASADL